MSAGQLEEWRAYYELEPWGGYRGDLQAGITASALWNIYRDRRKKQEPFTPEDFVLKFESPSPLATLTPTPLPPGEGGIRKMTAEGINRVLRGMFGG